MGLFNWLFRKACNAVFKRVDVNNDGRLDALEVEIAMLHLYNIFNKRLPGWDDPPSRQQIRDSLEAFDTNADGALDPEEFTAFARTMVRAGPDTFFRRLGSHTLVQAAVLPGAGFAVQRGLGMAFPALASVPLALFAPFLGNVLSGIRGLIPR